MCGEKQEVCSIAKAMRLITYKNPPGEEKGDFLLSNNSPPEARKTTVDACRRDIP